MAIVKCPRCQSLVDEAAHTICPACSTRLDGQGAARSQASPGARVSLGGEVFEAEPPTLNAPGMPSQARPMAPAGSRPPYSSPSGYRKPESAPDHSARNALLINLSVILILLLLCGGGGWWKWTHRTNPKSQVERYLHAIVWLDWGVVYDLSATPPGNKARHDFITMMDDKFDSNPVLKISARRNLETIHYDVGEPAIEGEEATLPVTVSGTRQQADGSFKLKLKNFGGVWKIYPLGENPLELLTDSSDEKGVGGALPVVPAVPFVPGAGQATP
jgi:hypothetical protein